MQCWWRWCWPSLKGVANEAINMATHSVTGLGHLRGRSLSASMSGFSLGSMMASMFSSVRMPVMHDATDSASPSHPTISPVVNSSKQKNLRTNAIFLCLSFCIPFHSIFLPVLSRWRSNRINVNRSAKTISQQLTNYAAKTMICSRILHPTRFFSNATMKWKLPDDLYYRKHICDKFNYFLFQPLLALLLLSPSWVAY